MHVYMHTCVYYIYIYYHVLLLGGGLVDSSISRWTCPLAAFHETILPKLVQLGRAKWWRNELLRWTWHAMNKLCLNEKKRMITHGMCSFYTNCLDAIIGYFSRKHVIPRQMLPICSKYEVYRSKSEWKYLKKEQMLTYFVVIVCLALVFINFFLWKNDLDLFRNPKWIQC